MLHQLSGETMRSSHNVPGLQRFEPWGLILASIHTPGDRDHNPSNSVPKTDRPPLTCYNNLTSAATVEFPCPHCQIAISTEASYAGLSAECPGCNHPLVIPATTSPLLVRVACLSDASELADIHTPPFTTRPNESSGQQENVSMLSRLTAGVGAVAGLEASESSGGFRSLFKDVFKSRTLQEMEEEFAVGTSRTTPAIGDVATHWPATWVFFRLIIFAFVGTFGFYWGLLHFGNTKMIPGWIFTGAFGLPFSVMIFFMEANVLRNISFYRVLKLFMLGGLLSLIFTLVLHEATGLGTLGPISAGPIEEPAKLLAAVFFTYKWRDKMWTLNGMLCGAAVGAGFAAFETAGYIMDVVLNFFVNDGVMGFAAEDVMFGRAIWSPFNHVVWTAATCGALWRLKGDRDFHFRMFGEWNFLRVLLLVAGIHAVWNSELVIPLVGDPWNVYLKYLGLGLIGWLLILLLMQNGLAQVRSAQFGSGLLSDDSMDGSSRSPEVSGALS